MGIRVLLDTHALVWAINAPDRLGSAARALLEQSDTAPVVSSVNLFEIAMKYRLGKWPEVAEVLENYDAYLAGLSAARLPVNDAHALRAGLLEYDHRDPFDRLLIAQSLVEKLPIVTLDAAIRAVPGVKTIW